MPNKTDIAIIVIVRHDIYIIDLNQLKGLHILNRAINPEHKIAIEHIVAKTSIEIPVNI